MLHLVQTKAGLAKCKGQTAKGDAVVFIGDGVIAASSVKNCDCYAIEEDLNRLGVNQIDGVQSCTMSDLVELVVTHKQSVSWR